MFCPKCGAEVQEGSLFCYKCGVNLSLNKENSCSMFAEIVNKLRIFKNKKIIIALLAVIIIAVIGTVYLNNPISRFKNNITNNNYIEAVKIYDDKIKGNIDKENMVLRFLESEINKIEDLFINENITYDKAKSKLTTIKNTGLVSAEVNNALNRIDNLNNSRIAYKKAEQYLKNNDILNALKEYKNVIPEDQNYKRAKEQIANNEKQYKEQVLKSAEEFANKQEYDKSVSLLKEATSLIPNDSDLTSKLSVYEKQLHEKLFAEQLVIVESAKIIIQDATYKALYPDMIQVIVKNNSDKTIKNMNVGCLGYDKNGYPLKIKTQFDFSGGYYEFVGSATDVNIIAGSRFGQDKGWSLDESHGISKVLACVKNATFYDGTTWENPYYGYWLDQYKEKPLH